ncbi:MAG: peptidoglycan editing factor PgeF [Lachnospiraceae bacterium]|nr:peptidoglycan editing factor PgeF [Lachnospiraceae bacterium]
MAVVIDYKGDFPYLAAENIKVPHCFTTRAGGVSTGIFDSLNMGRHRGDSDENVDRNFRRLAEAMGIGADALVLTRQIHSDIVRRVTKTDHCTLDHRDYPECDALITDDPGCGLVIFTADCTPLLFWDPVTGAVGAAHAGWRGTASRIGSKTVRAMVEAFGCRPEDIRTAIGPNIGQCCFQTDEDVPLAMKAAFGHEAEPFIRFDGEKYYSDLKQLNALDLWQAGVREMEISEVCTMCDHERFWSHRYTGGQRGSQGAVIVCGKHG